ncbi:MAG TPA: DHA2 family efflux MFS transporter permease subunit, partial [Ktedonobacteraceae bacterium]|nr:DHA2 family efflux MFS transporter permease subunit [Ktedonobacteraceae bacterium]
LDLTASGRSWIINAYLLTLAVTIAAAGHLSSIVGHRRIFLSGIIIFTGASVLCGAANGGIMLITFRAVAGLGAALIAPTSQTIITDTFSSRDHGKALGIYSGVSAAGVVLGPILSGSLTGFFGWRWVFYVNLPIGLAIFLITLYAPPAEKRRQDKIDWAGLILLMVGLLALIIALMQSDDWGHTSPAFLGILTLGLVCLAVFVMIERRIKEPLLDFTLFRNHNFLGNSLIMFIMRFALFGMAVYPPIFVQEVLGFTPQLTGIATLPCTQMLMLISPRTGKLYHRRGIRFVATLSIGLALLGFLWLAILGFPQQSYWWLLPAYIMVGSGIAFNTTPTTTDLIASAPAQNRDQAVGILSTMQQLGGTVSIAILTAVITPLTYNKVTTSLAARGIQITKEQLQSALPTYILTRQLPPGVTLQDLQTLKLSFTAALSIAFLLIAALLLVGLIIARTLLQHARYGQSETLVGEAPLC